MLFVFTPHECYIVWLQSQAQGVQPSLEELAKDPIMKELQGELAAVSAATKALALRWIRMARDVMEAKFKHRSDNFREDVDTLLGTSAHTYIQTKIN